MGNTHYDIWDEATHLVNGDTARKKADGPLTEVAALRGAVGLEWPDPVMTSDYPPRPTKEL